MGITLIAGGTGIGKSALINEIHKPFVAHNGYFLKTQFKEALAISERLLSYKEIAQTEYISPDQALAEFKLLSGFGEIVDSLEENPLPAIILVTPVHNSAEGVSLLAKIGV